MVNPRRLDRYRILAGVIDSIGDGVVLVDSATGAYLEANRRAFAAGREAVAKQLGATTPA